MLASMRPCTQRLLDDLPAIRAILARVVGWDSNRDHTKHFPKILNPGTKLSPPYIRDGFSEVSIPHHIPHFQVLVGYQVVRLDYAPCRLHSKVFTLPTYLEVFTSQFISKLRSILRPFLGQCKTVLSTRPLDVQPALV